MGVPSKKDRGFSPPSPETNILRATRLEGCSVFPGDRRFGDEALGECGETREADPGQCWRSAKEGPRGQPRERIGSTEHSEELLRGHAKIRRRGQGDGYPEQCWSTSVERKKEPHRDQRSIEPPRNQLLRARANSHRALPRKGTAGGPAAVGAPAG